MDESKEKSPLKENEQVRMLTVYLVRHGDAVYKDRQDKDGVLTDEGKRQSEKAAEELFDLISNGAVKFYSSPFGRAAQTAEIIKKKLEDKISETGKNITIYKTGPRERKGLTSIDLLTDTYLKLRGEGIRDPVQHWLNNPDQSPQSALAFLEDMVSRYEDLTKRISPEGSGLNLVCVTHGGNPELFLQKITKLPQIPNLENCEIIQLNFPCTAEKKPSLIYKGNEYPIG